MFTRAAGSPGSRWIGRSPWHRLPWLLIFPRARTCRAMISSDPGHVSYVGISTNLRSEEICVLAKFECMRGGYDGNGAWWRHMLGWKSSSLRPKETVQCGSISLLCSGAARYLMAGNDTSCVQFTIGGKCMNPVFERSMLWFRFLFLHFDGH